MYCACPSRYRLVGLVVKASASRATDLGFESRLRWDFSGSSHTSDLEKMVLQGLPCQEPGFGIRERMSGKFDQQLLSQCGSTYNCLSRSVPEIHYHVAWALSSEPKPKQKQNQNKTKQNKNPNQNKPKTNQTKPNQTKLKQNKTKQNKTKQNKTKQNKTKQNKTKQNKTKQNKSKQIGLRPPSVKEERYAWSINQPIQQRSSICIERH